MKSKRKIQIFLNKVCPNTYNKLIFLIKNHYWCNLKNPITFNEKIQWRKLNQHDVRYTSLVDKYDVCEYIEKVYPGLLVPMYRLYDRPEYVDFDELPDKFIIKPTHGFGQVIICNDKRELDKNKALSIIKDWFDYNQFYITGEWQYKQIKPRVIVNELLGSNIRDYKFFCFDGEPYAIQIDSDRYIEHKRQFRNVNWERISCELAYPNDNTELDKPAKLNEMLNVCRMLSRDFDFVRVDLFLVNGKIYFSELTFTPGNGMERFIPKRMDLQFGLKWKLRYEKI